MCDTDAAAAAVISHYRLSEEAPEHAAIARQLKEQRALLDERLQRIRHERLQAFKLAHSSSSSWSLQPSDADVNHHSASAFSVPAVSSHAQLLQQTALLLQSATLLLGDRDIAINTLISFLTQQQSPSSPFSNSALQPAEPAPPAQAARAAVVSPRPSLQVVVSSSAAPAETARSPLDSPSSMLAEGGTSTRVSTGSASPVSSPSSPSLLSSSPVGSPSRSPTASPSEIHPALLGQSYPLLMSPYHPLVRPLPPSPHPPSPLRVELRPRRSFSYQPSPSQSPAPLGSPLTVRHLGSQQTPERDAKQQRQDRWARDRQSAPQPTTAEDEQREDEKDGKREKHEQQRNGVSHRDQLLRSPSPSAADLPLNRSALSASSSSLRAAAQPAPPRRSPPPAAASTVRRTSRASGGLSTSFSSPLAATLTERKQKDRERRERAERAQADRIRGRVSSAASAAASRKRQEEQRQRQQLQEEQAEEERRQREKEAAELAAVRSAHLAHLQRTRQERLQQQARQTQRIASSSSRLFFSKSASAAGLSRSVGSGGGEDGRLEQLLRDASLSREEGKDRRDRALRELARGRREVRDAGRSSSTKSAASASVSSLLDEDWSRHMLREMMDDYQHAKRAANAGRGSASLNVTR